MNTKANPAHTGNARQTAEDLRDVAKEKLSVAAESAAATMRDAGTHYVAEPASDLFSMLRDYSKQKPDVAAMWCFGIGVMIGWKLRG